MLIIGKNDLKSFCINNNKQDLLEEWDYDKNEELNPSNIYYGTRKKVWWRGKCGHEYLASINARTANGTGCPYCCKSHAKLLKGFNDLATTNPDLLDSWDYNKNGDLLPSMVMKGQHIKVWWKGECGHSWQASIYHRVSGRGCPICRSEYKTSFQEQAIFFYIKKHFKDAENGNTTVLNGKELDIYIPSQRIGIEFDGEKWHEDATKDEYKNQLCESKGIYLYRIRNIKSPVLKENKNIDIIKFEAYSDVELERVLIELTNKLQIKIDVDINRDRSLIYEQFLNKIKDESLSKLFPEISQEWNYEKNGKLTPDIVSAKSNKKVWWKGKCGHEWQANIASRTNLGASCPYCNSNRLLEGFNDLETIEPQILKYWNYDKNIVKPNEVTATSSKKVWWHCNKCNNDYMASIHNKVKFPNSCPHCSHRIAIKGKTDLETLEPEIASEWDYEKNENILPSDVLKWTEKMVWWKCKNGHSYKATVSNRCHGRGCPYCSGNKAMKHYNDLASKRPDLLEEWNYEKNTIKPTEVTEHSGKKVWWRCKNGHTWQAVIDSRSKGAGCPYCKGCAKKRVKNIDTGEIFSSLADAAKSCGLKCGDTISFCCQGKQEKAGGYRWKYIEN